jgi:hypothetical protein
MMTPMPAPWQAVGVVGGEEIDAVVAPPALARELGHGQELEVGDAEVDEVGESGDGGVERAVGGERADVGLVDERPRQRRRPPPQVVRPPEGGVVHHPGPAVDPLRLELRPGIGERRAAVERELVVGSRAGVRHVDRPPSRPAIPLHRYPPRLGRQHEIDPLGRLRSPHAECRHPLLLESALFSSTCRNCGTPERSRSQPAFLSSTAWNSGTPVGLPRRLKAHAPGVRRGTGRGGRPGAPRR